MINKFCLGKSRLEDDYYGNEKKLLRNNYVLNFFEE